MRRADMKFFASNVSNSFDDVFASDIVINLLFFQRVDQSGKRCGNLILLRFLAITRSLIEPNRRGRFDQKETFLGQTSTRQDVG